MDITKIKSLEASVEDVKRDEGIVTIAISRFDIADHADDIVRKGAFAKTFANDIARIKHCIDHVWSMDSIVGTPRKMWETDEYAIVESKLIMGKPIAHDLFETYKHFAEEGRQIEHSYAYTVTRTNPNNSISGEDIAELSMHEYSTVFRGCNPFTPALDVKGMTHFEQLEGYVDELSRLLRKCDFTDVGGARVETLIKSIENVSAELRARNVDPSIEKFEQMKQDILDTFRKSLYN